MKQLLAISIALFCVSSGQAPLAANSLGSFEVTLQLRSFTNTRALNSAEEQAYALQQVTVIKRRNVQGAPPQQRNPELSEQQLLVIAHNVHGEEVSRVLIPDPRIIRAETITPNNHVVSRFFLKNSGECTLVFPNNPEIRILKIYHPKWTGAEFILNPLGETLVP